MSEKKTEPLKSDGGFNPDRKGPPKVQTVGPLPTGDPNGEASPSLKKELKKEAEQR
jgi:hypothetical protein